MKKRRTRKKSRRTQKKKVIDALDDPKEPIRRGVPIEPRMKRDQFSFLCLADLNVFQQKLSPTQERFARCPKCNSAEDVVIYR